MRSERGNRIGPLLVAVLGVGALGTPLPASAQSPADTSRKKTSTEEIVVSAARRADEQVTEQVQRTLTNDPWIYAEHITVTTRNGVVRLEGIVGDTGELYRILRQCRKIPGARRVVSELEMMHNDPDGG
jgi:osmotically-inducible protein OsmY